MSDAFERAARRGGFRIHLTVFIGVQILLVAVWVLQWQLDGTGHLWFIYPLLGWGIRLAAHYAAVRDRHGEAADSRG